MSRDLNSREELDVTDMLREAARAEPEDVEGTIVWYEWVRQNGRQYQLSYWFDDHDDEYKAAVIEGLEPNEQLFRSISSDGMINLKSSHNTPCSGVVEARRKALTILQSLGEVKIMRIMTLGFSTAGKTFYLGSLGKLSIPGPKGFSLQAQNFIDPGGIKALYRSVASELGMNIDTTVGLTPYLMVLKQGINPIINIEITDIEGQALEDGRNTEIAGRILDEIGDYDGLILIVETPKTPGDSQNVQGQLAQMLNFASEVLKKKAIPLTLVLTKIDKLIEKQEIVAALNNDLNDFESELKKRYNNFREIEKQIQIKRGSVVNKYVKDLINTREVYQLYETFFRFLRPSTNINIPNKVFPSTSLGFNSFTENDKNNLTFEKYRQQQIYEPYGSAASFLWTIYAGILGQTEESLEGLTERVSISALKEDLLEEIRALHTSGQAYFTPENDEPERDIFSLRNISNLRTHQIGA